MFIQKYKSVSDILLIVKHMKCIIKIFLLTFVVIFHSCDDRYPEFCACYSFDNTQTTAKSITENSAELSCYLESLNSGIRREGSLYMCVSTNANVSSGIFYWISDYCDPPKTYTIKIRGLKSNTTYYYAPCIINNHDREKIILLGDVKSFHTTIQEKTIRVYTGDAKDITSTSVKLDGECEPTGGAILYQSGHILNTSSTLSYYNNIKYTYCTYTSYISTIVNLSRNTTYYYQAYAIDDEGYIYYGSIKSFKTSR